MALEGLLDILVCPACKARLTLAGEGAFLLCGSCKLHFPVREGIPVMLLNEAIAANEKEPGIER